MPTLNPDAVQLDIAPKGAIIKFRGKVYLVVSPGVFQPLKETKSNVYAYDGEVRTAAQLRGKSGTRKKKASRSVSGVKDRAHREMQATTPYWWKEALEALDASRDYANVSLQELKAIKKQVAEQLREAKRMPREELGAVKQRNSKPRLSRKASSNTQRTRPPSCICSDG